MPLINGLKMACEPCIRGHRSTKCTHANERLMVPVRKPGRPLSACPHPREQGCECGSVTAAIPRKQTCRCGNSNGTSENVTTPAPKSSSSSLADLPSPTKATFKVMKPTQHRPGSSRKQSFDPAYLQRIDINQLNILPGALPASMPNGYAIPNGGVNYGMSVQYPNMQSQYTPISMQAPPQLHRQSIDETLATLPATNGSNGYTNIVSENGLEHVMESPLSTPTPFTAGENKFGNGAPFVFPEAGMVGLKNGTAPRTNGRSCCGPPKVESGDSKHLLNNNTSGNHDLPARNGNSQRRSSVNGGACCAPRKTHSQSSSSSSISEAPESQTSSCCSSKPQSTFKEEPMSTAGTPQIHHQVLPQNGVDFNTPMYTSYPPQATVFTYPATYGSFQNPLHPSAWRQNMREGNYIQQPMLIPEQLPFDAPLLPETLDTVHSCTCGDGCQCIGCAAHPYNDATQDYVRSAWESMSLEQPASRDSYAPHVNGNGGVAVNPSTPDDLASPKALTPSSTASGNGEEQSLSANDFFFVNYTFPSLDGCGGDTYSCPCGDDCQCIGCEIHKHDTLTT